MAYINEPIFKFSVRKSARHLVIEGYETDRNDRDYRSIVGCKFELYKMKKNGSQKNPKLMAEIKWNTPTLKIEEAGVYHVVPTFGAVATIKKHFSFFSEKCPT